MKKIIVIVSFITALFGDFIEDSYYKSYNYEKMGDYKDAIKVLIPLYQKYPKGYTINLRLAWLFYLNKNYKNAIKHYKTCELIMPYSIEVKLGLMKIYLISDLDKALNIGNSILKIDYYNYYGNYYEILALKAKKEINTAINITNKMLSLYPTDVMYLTLLGELYWNKDRKYAKEIFKNILILDPNNIKAKTYLK